ncbi:3-oxoacyl-ACP synthase [Mucilaginibacter segetis]|uniref:3-oxoacyl-ACP synthase n=1 Tax=Mucilaginibacter segetis TaxID=2793071 RepID=A0A934UPJ3_9SPHI|nr:3-oxoacyl-ACP synthase [Mucilaginibacter segetis]MBK0381175.1 3-oxoacyl-ACP synthase [Mucilaginibacter segetis]
MDDIKATLHKLCIDYVQSRMQAAEDAIKEAQNAAKDDTKSSAGDKYETGREMMQQETNRNMAQLTEANKLMVALNQVHYTPVYTTAAPGSLVTTNNGTFYIAISAGILSLDGKSYYAVSPASPIGLKLTGKKTGETFSLNEKNYQITSII